MIELSYDLITYIHIYVHADISAKVLRVLTT
jgi:hypothetical protein